MATRKANKARKVKKVKKPQSPQHRMRQVDKKLAQLRPKHEQLGTQIADLEAEKQGLQAEIDAAAPPPPA